jgi:2-amino-4-hydroxy-6-hydroxymethyldihydropteridine diphosphokinase
VTSEPAAASKYVRPRVAVRAVIALGANLGDREATLRQAVADIAAVGGIRLVAASVPIESVALTDAGLDDTKPSYLNGAVLVESTLSPEALLTELNRIETSHGRVRLEHWGDRTLDLDLIVHGEAVFTSERLTLPHPRAAERTFVLEPWLQVDPAASVPGGGSVAELLAALLASGEGSVDRVAGASRLDQGVGFAAAAGGPAPVVSDGASANTPGTPGTPSTPGAASVAGGPVGPSGPMGPAGPVGPAFAADLAVPVSSHRASGSTA